MAGIKYVLQKEIFDAVDEKIVSVCSGKQVGSENKKNIKQHSSLMKQFCRCRRKARRNPRISVLSQQRNQK
jgi:hypothetical protein